MKEVYRLPFDEAIAHAEIEALKKQRNALQDKIDEVLKIPRRPIDEAGTEAGRSNRRGFNEFRSLVHDIFRDPAQKEAQHG